MATLATALWPKSRGLRRAAESGFYISWTPGGLQFGPVIASEHGAVAQLGERCRGTAEVQGSSPCSSIASDHQRSSPPWIRSSGGRQVPALRGDKVVTTGIGVVW
jgi:hypothetical protein